MVRRSINILLFFTVFFLAGISWVNASVSHDHHEEISDSPFHGKSKNHSLHCLLNKHHPLGQVCPHTHARGGNEEVRMAADCGGNPNGTVPAPPGSSKSNFLYSANSLLPVLRSAENIFVSSDFYQYIFSDLIDHPPRSY